MLVVERPDEASLRRIQARDRAYYWSSCVEGLLRKHGLVGVTGRRQDDRDFAIVTRGVDAAETARGRGCFEGPLDASVARALNIGTKDHAAALLELYDTEGRSLGTLTYFALKVRRIPTRRGEESLPYDFVSDDALANAPDIRFQELEARDPWVPLAYARAEGARERVVVAASDGSRRVLGLPLFDLAGRTHWFPPLDAGYYAMTRYASVSLCEQWLIDEILAHASRAAPVVRAQPWPEGRRTALTVRHDHDRPISPEATGSLLARYERMGIKSSWGFLIRLLDPELGAQLLAHDHEVALHTEAGSADAFRREVETIAQALGNAPAGYTAHGGIGSAGYLGEAQNRWARDCGLLYGELPGNGDNRLPHPANFVDSGLPGIGRLVLPPVHMSFDRTTKPEDHYLEHFREVVPTRLREARHVVLMNHPDIHVDEFTTLLGELELSTTWLATLEQVADWCDVALFRSSVVRKDRALFVVFPAPLPHEARFTLVEDDSTATVQICEAGATELEVDLTDTKPR